MEIQAIVLGTAGHIDHGKSTLVRALTGTDPDRLKEEKERGLTIDLGFANLELPDGRRVGIVDVPGHERFIRNMAAGASGIDLVMLVVAADDGVMPQTREHLAVMELLGVRRGFVALTKVDAVDPELVELAAEDVREFVAGTFLEGAPLLPVSALSGEGMDALKDVLFSMASETEERSNEGVFRMPVQRVFSARGFGTILTGIPIAGEVQVGQQLEVLPHGFKGKVRGLQAYGEKVDRARAGHSTAINLADVEHKSVGRGDVVASSGFFEKSSMLGARLTALPTLDRTITDRMPIRLHTGTADPPGELVLLDQEQLEPGETGLVQLRLEHPVVAAPGDRFVLRLLTPAITLGGGVLIEESRYRLKRFKGYVLESLGRQEQSLGSLGEQLSAGLVAAGPKPQSTEALAKLVKRDKKDVQARLEALAQEERAHFLGRGGKGSGWLDADALDGALDGIAQALDAWFAAQPHRYLIERAELATETGHDSALLGNLLSLAEERGRVALASGGRVRPAEREPVLDEAQRALLEALHASLEAGKQAPPSVEELVDAHGKQAPLLLETLADQGRAARCAELYFSESAMQRAREAVTANCQKNGQLEIPELRDALDTTRKFLIPLLERLDAEGLTLRQGGHRILKTR